MPRSVVIVLLSAIGDVVHGMPIATSLRRAWPDARIHWVIQSLGRGLVGPHPAVDEFIPFDRSRGAAGFADFRRRVTGRSFDVAIGLQVYMKAGVLTRMLPARRRLGFDRARARDLNWLFTNERIPAHPPQHVQDQYFEFLDYLGVPALREWEFAFSEEERQAQLRFFERIDRPALAVVLRTTRPGKNWPAGSVRPGAGDRGVGPRTSAGADRQPGAVGGGRRGRTDAADARPTDPCTRK